MLDLDAFEWLDLEGARGAPGATKKGAKKGEKKRGATPPMRHGHRFAVAGDSAFLFGGERCGAAHTPLCADVWRYDLHHHTWEEVKTRGPCAPPGRKLHALWHEPSAEVAGPGRLLVYGGEIWPGAGSGSRMDRPNGVQSSDDFWAFDLATRAWRVLRVLGDHPNFVQEATVLPLDGGRSCLLWGGYNEGSGASLNRMVENRSRVHDDDWTPQPYLRSVFAWDARTRHWRRLQKLGDESALMAQAWVAATSASSFVIGGGYGVYSGEQAQGAGVHPRTLDAYYECRVHRDDDGSSLDCWGKSASILYVPSRDSRVSFDVTRSTNPDGPSTVNAIFDFTRGVFTNRTQMMIDQMGLREIAHVWAASLDGGKYQMNRDTYHGPVSKEARELLEPSGWVADDARKCHIMSDPHGILPDKKKSPDGEASPAKAASSFGDTVPAMAKLCQRLRERDAPCAAELTKRLVASQRSGDHGTRLLTLRVEVCGMIPCIWRLVRVAVHVSLAALHDQVLCPVLGHQRSYHAYAFRRTASNDSVPKEPWFGPAQSTAIDMVHAPLYIGAMADDTKIQLGDVLKEVGEELDYVYDLGDCASSRSRAHAPARACSRVNSDFVLAPLFLPVALSLATDRVVVSHFRRRHRR